jgi:hypothetical protein
MREAVGLLEKPAKILPLARKNETKKAVTIEKMVESRGIEPLTSAMPLQRSPS